MPALEFLEPRILGRPDVNDRCQSKAVSQFMEGCGVFEGNVVKFTKGEGAMIFSTSSLLNDSLTTPQVAYSYKVHRLRAHAGYRPATVPASVSFDAWQPFNH